MKAIVPRYQFFGNSAHLECDYDIGNHTLYSIKWYKEHVEFYRYLPRDTTSQTYSFNLPGVYVNVTHLIKTLLFI